MYEVSSIKAYVYSHTDFVNLKCMYSIRFEEKTEIYILVYTIYLFKRNCAQLSSTVYEIPNAVCMSSWRTALKKGEGVMLLVVVVVVATGFCGS